MSDLTTYYKPVRIFDAYEGDWSVDEKGPEALKNDLDAINKMFDPEATHEDGTTGGISKENINFQVQDKLMWDSVPTEGSSNAVSSGAVKTALDNAINTNYENIARWLESHPEATTTVQNKSISKAKLADDVTGNLAATELVDDYFFAQRYIDFDAKTIGAGYYLNGGCFTDKYLVMAFHDQDYQDYIGVFDIATYDLITTLDDNPFQFTQSQKIGDMTFNPVTNEIILTSKVNPVLYALDADDFSLTRTIDLDVGVAGIAYDVDKNCYTANGSGIFYIFDDEFSVISSFNFIQVGTRQTCFASIGLIWLLTFVSSSSPAYPAGVMSVFDHYGNLYKEYLLPWSLGEGEFHAVDPRNNLMYIGFTSNGVVSIYRTQYLSSKRYNSFTRYEALLKDFNINFAKHVFYYIDATVDKSIVNGTIRIKRTFQVASIRLSLTLVDVTQGEVIATIPEFTNCSELFPVVIAEDTLGSENNKLYNGVIQINASGQLKLFGDPDGFVANNRVYASFTMIIPF